MSLKDAQGSVRKVVDTTGSVVASYDYDAWGNILGQDQPSGWIFYHRAFGGVLDPNLGMTYLRARWMDPTTGRFESRDPSSGLSARPLTLHKYLYAGASPQRYSDPSGEFFLAVLLASVALVGILATSSLGATDISDPLAAPYDGTVGLTLVLPKNSNGWDRSKLVSMMNRASEIWSDPPTPYIRFEQVHFEEADEKYRVIDDTNAKDTGNPTVQDIVTDVASDPSTLTFVFADKILAGDSIPKGSKECGVAKQPGRAGAVSAEGACPDGIYLAHEIGHNGGLHHEGDANRLMNPTPTGTVLTAEEKKGWYLYMKNWGRLR